MDNCSPELVKRSPVPEVVGPSPVSQGNLSRSSATHLCNMPVWLGEHWWDQGHGPQSICGIDAEWEKTCAIFFTEHLAEHV